MENIAFDSSIIMGLLKKWIYLTKSNETGSFFLIGSSLDRFFASTNFFQSSASGELFSN